ncbi:hypothetical protein KP509_01G053600 [Ceratopteris richardii]|nr:hypothetical protein KP509_01G053600 [Ceratopteris richardii]
MRHSGLDADGHVYVAVIKATKISGSILQGRVVHSHVFEGSLEHDIYVSNALIDMYANVCCLEDAHNIFERSSKLDVVTWNSFISGLLRHGYEEKALTYFQQMQLGGIQATAITFSCILKSCSNLMNRNQGMLIHMLVLEVGYDSDSCLFNTLLDFYLRCCSSCDALVMCRKCVNRNLVTWNIMVSGLVKQGDSDKALGCWADFLREGGNPDRISFLSSLKACGSLGALYEGRLIHAQILEIDLNTDTSIVNTLMDMYCGCGAIDDAYRVFVSLPKEDVVAWNVMMKGILQSGHSWDSLQLFRRMQLECFLPTGFSYVCAFNVIANFLGLILGKALHACVLAYSHIIDMQLRNALIDMYLKCDDLYGAHKFFNRSPQQDMATWNTMLAGFVEHDNAEQALELFGALFQAGLEPDRITIILILKVCTTIAALDEGKTIHAYVIDLGMESKTSIVNVIIDMYSKWESMDDSQCVFDKSHKRDVVTWSALMSGYAQQGEYKFVMNIYKTMDQEGVKPDAITLACILSAYCQVGEVKEAHGFLNKVSEISGVHLGIEHHNHLVDLLGRAGYLLESKQILDIMSHHPNSIGWSSLLAHCCTHGNIDLGKICLSRISETDEEYLTGLVLISNLYTESHD